MPNTPQLKHRKIYEALRRKGMSKQRAAMISNAKEAMAIPPTGANALFNSFGIGRRLRKRRKTECTCTVKATGAPGEKLAPGVTRIHGNLCNVHGRYGPCDTGLAKKKPAKGRARKPAKPKKTDAQRSAERDQKRQANVNAVTQRMAESDTGIAPGGVNALQALSQGQQPSAGIGKQLADIGLMEQAQDGSFRMTPTARAALSAMAAGDYQRTVDAISRATDQAHARQDRQSAHQQRQQAATQRRAESEAKRTARAAETAKRRQERAKKKPAKAGSNKQPVQTLSASSPRPASPSRHSSSGGSAPSTGASSSPKKQQPAKAEPQPEKPQIAPELRDAASKLSDGQTLTDKELEQLVTNGLVKINKDGTPVLTAAGQRATMKETFGGKKRSKLDDSVFAGPDRSFPIVSAQDVRDAVQSLGRTNHGKDAVKRGIIRRARAIGATDALPESWREKSVFTVFKDARGQDRWLSITTTAYEDKDREWISCQAIEGAVALGDKTKERGTLRYWHVPGMDFGVCDFQATTQEGRFLIESGTCYSPMHAAIVRKAAAQGWQMSPGFVHPVGEPHDGVYHHIAIFERSFVPPGRAANPWTRLMTKETTGMVEEKQKALADLAGDEQVLASLLGTAQKTDKSAQDRAAVYKDAPAWAQALVADIEALRAEVKEAKVTNLNVAPNVAPGADPIAVAQSLASSEKAMAPASMEQAAETEMADAEDEQADDEPDGDEGMDDAAFAQLIAQAVVQALTPLLDVEKKMGGYLNEMKGLMGNLSSAKDDAQAKLTERVEKNESALKELARGEFPRSVFADQVLSGAGGMFRPSQALDTQIPPAEAQKVKELSTERPTPPSDVNPDQFQDAYTLIFGT